MNDSNINNTKIGIIVTNGCAFPHTEAIRRVARKWAIPYLDVAADYQVLMMHRAEENNKYFSCNVLIFSCTLHIIVSKERK